MADKSARNELHSFKHTQTIQSTLLNYSSRLIPIQWRVPSCDEADQNVKLEYFHRGSLPCPTGLQDKVSRFIPSKNTWSLLGMLNNHFVLLKMISNKFCLEW
ncbi:hypothetical protein AVEN_179611-1 [Araneus ventricosus]|uniref:Uncharacterized protein n=1 Tax=Araneus ventricosus TaxID=182803 RepID=A0A4Y2BCB1_ARAVE|nr:hypothetical protein AVEN_179611-1 [Araneus ventricosus]